LTLLPVGEPPDSRTTARAVEALLGGDCLVFPTDTLYALGCRALDGAAVERLRALKGRDDGKPLPVVAADVAQARTLWATWPEEAARIADRFWPGPVTLVLPAAPNLPSGLTAGGTSLAVRVPASRLDRELCAAAGPLVSTSANRAAERPHETCAAALRALAGSDVLGLDAGRGSPSPSTIVDLTGTAARILREGAVPGEAVLRLLKLRGRC
jgi:L-threonylcarbamoyladenylate synthase